ncbi:hypothetical protein [Vibrio crassostreae]|uniref:hypothetical protein n=1 Tax=Vibrio crassostreae TaxID=246167 RepID=UPI001B30C04D|nr:hypothetical protein [Vibrio crassostreae]
MISIGESAKIKSMTHALHAAMKAKPNMKLSEFREIFSKELTGNDWNTTLAQVSKPKFEEFCIEDLKELIEDNRKISSTIELNHSVEEPWDLSGILETVNDSLNLDIDEAHVGEDFKEWLLTHFNTCHTCGATLDEMNYCTCEQCLMNNFTQDTEFDEYATVWRSLNGHRRVEVMTDVSFYSNSTEARMDESIDFGYVLNFARKNDQLDMVVTFVKENDDEALQTYFAKFMDEYRGKDPQINRIMRFKGERKKPVRVESPISKEVLKWVETNQTN